MNKEPINPNKDPLDSVLKQWRMDAALPPRFQEQVWSRIERNTVNEPIALWPLVLDWLKSSVARPAFAVAYAIILLVLGITGGFLQAQRDNARFDNIVEARYVQSVDPYQKAGAP